MNASDAITHSDVSAAVQILRRAWTSLTAKRAAIAAGRSHRTCEGWLSGRGEPSLSDALRMAERDAAFREELGRELAAIECRLNEGKRHV